MYLCHSVWVSLFPDSIRLTGQFRYEFQTYLVPQFYIKEIKLFRTTSFVHIDKMILTEFFKTGIEKREWVTSDTVKVCFCRNNGELILEKTYREFKDSYHYMLDMSKWRIE